MVLIHEKPNQGVRERKKVVIYLGTTVTNPDLIQEEIKWGL
jgi:hypothetical protein